MNANDLAAASKIMPGVETVTFTSKTSAGNTAASVTGAYREPQRKRRFEPQATRPATTADSTQWLLPKASLGAVTPKVKDTITDSSNVLWTVISLSHEMLGAVWRLDCVRERT